MNLVLGMVEVWKLLEMEMDMRFVSFLLFLCFGHKINFFMRHIQWKSIPKIIFICPWRVGLGTGAESPEASLEFRPLGEQRVQLFRTLLSRSASCL